MSDAQKPGGHWPAGKRRNADSGHWSRARLAVSRLIEDHWKRGVISMTALARDVGVNEKSVRRWLDGTDRPSEERQLAVREWLRSQLQLIAAERKKMNRKR